METNKEILSLLNKVSEVILNLNNEDYIDGSSNWKLLMNLSDTTEMGAKIYDYVENLFMGTHVSIEDNDTMDRNSPIKILENKVREHFSIVYLNYLKKQELSEFDKRILDEIKNFAN